MKKAFFMTAAVALFACFGLLTASVMFADVASAATLGDVAHHAFGQFDVEGILAAIPPLAALRQKRSDLKAEATAILDKADADNDGELSAEAEQRYSEIEAELQTVGDKIVAEERKIERRRSLDAIRSVVPAGESVTDEPNPETTGGFKSMAEFAVAVRRASVPGGGPVDTRLMAAPTNYHEGGGSSGEGYNLPVQYRDEIWELVMGMEGLMNTVDLEPTAARQVDFVKDETTPWGSSGVQAYWRAEASQMTASKQATKGDSLPLHELYAFVLATEELLEDAPRLGARLTRKSAEAINWKIDDSIIYGTGAGQPLGWFNSDALVSVAEESGQSADTIVAQNVLKMYSRLLVQPGSSPYWLTNRDTVPQLAVMTIGDQPVWQPPNGLAGAPGGYLLGYPVRYSEHAKTLGDKGDIQLIEPKGYYAARRTAGIQFASSMHLYFDYAIQAFRWMFRFGGQPHLSGPVSPANGTNTKSHFVTLDERAG